jgi:hypothetical protein
MVPSAVYLVFPHKSPGYRSFAERGNPEGAAELGDVRKHLAREATVLWAGVIDFGGFLGHDRQIFGYTSWMGYQPQEDATIIVLVNLYQGPTALSLPTNSRR